MRLRDFSLLTDESVNPRVVAHLRERGFDVIDVKESSLVGTPDIDLIRIAVSRRRVLLTHDRDFGRLATGMLEPMVGIVFLRPGHIDPAFTIASLEALFHQDLDVAPPFVIVAERTADEVKIRVRQY